MTAYEVWEVSPEERAVAQFDERESAEDFALRLADGRHGIRRAEVREVDG